MPEECATTIYISLPQVGQPLRYDGLKITNLPGPILQPDGSLTAPAYSYTNDTDTGLRRIGDNSMGFVVGGADGLYATKLFSGDVAVFANGFRLAIWSPVKKTADQSKTSDTTLAADSALKFTMAANTDYLFRLVIFYTAATASDFKFDFNGPAGVGQFRAMSSIVDPDGVHTAVLDTALNNSRSITAASGTHGAIVIEGKIENGANAGDLEFRWAQNASSIGAVTVLEGSHLEYQKQ